MNDKTIHFRYHFQTLAADVLPANIGDYNEQIDKIRKHLGRSLTYLPRMDLDAPGAYGPNWIGFIIFGLVLATSGDGAYRIYSLRPSNGHLEIPVGLEQYEGVRGWLILVFIGLAQGILGDANTARYSDVVFNLTKWNLLTLPGASRYDPLWAPTLLFELISCGVHLVLLILAIVLMFQKRFTFPGVMIAVLVGNLVYHLIDQVLRSQISSSANHSEAFAQNDLSMLVGCVIWIPYFLVSKRVKATFRY